MTRRNFDILNWKCVVHECDRQTDRQTTWPIAIARFVAVKIAWYSTWCEDAVCLDHPDTSKQADAQMALQPVHCRLLLRCSDWINEVRSSVLTTRHKHGWAVFSSNVLKLWPLFEASALRTSRDAVARHVIHLKAINYNYSASRVICYAKTSSDASSNKSDRSQLSLIPRHQNEKLK